MRETERRIKEHQERLPHMKEKLAAVALMLIISVAMMTSATFAWVVLSKSPEVKGMTTTVAANGNLEIALVDGDGKTEPKASEVGDSGKDIALKNVTWGNLVNLSDPSYGLENITLRPATLNLSKLLDSPLRGAEYGDDGRVTKLSSDFAYTNYDAENETFVVPTTEEYGVRAISTIRYGSLTGDATYIECLDLIETTIGMAEGQYETLVGTSDGENPYITVISGLIGDYLTMKFGGDDDMDCTKYVVDINNMMQDFKKCMDTTGLALTYIANTQVLINTGEVGTYTLDSLLATSSSELSNAGINLTTLSQYKTNLTKLDGYLVKMEDYVQQTTVIR